MPWWGGERKLALEEQHETEVAAGIGVPISSPQSSLPSPPAPHLTLPFPSLSRGASHSLSAPGKRPPKKRGRGEAGGAPHSLLALPKSLPTLLLKPWLWVSEGAVCQPCLPRGHFCCQPGLHLFLQGLLMTKHKSKDLGHFLHPPYLSPHTLVTALHLSPCQRARGEFSPTKSSG